MADPRDLIRYQEYRDLLKQENSPYKHIDELIEETKKELAEEFAKQKLNKDDQ